MNSNEIQKIFQLIAKRVRCPHCGRQYLLENIHVLRSAENDCLLQLDCKGHSPTLARVSIIGPRIVVDNKRGKITANDLLDAYQKLSQAKKIEELFK